MSLLKVSLHPASLVFPQVTIPLLLDPRTSMSSAVLFVLCIMFHLLPVICVSWTSESKSVNRQTEVLLDSGLLSWYTVGLGSLISVDQKDPG